MSILKQITRPKNIAGLHWNKLCIHTFLISSIFVGQEKNSHTDKSDWEFLQLTEDSKSWPWWGSQLSPPTRPSRQTHIALGHQLPSLLSQPLPLPHLLRSFFHLLSWSPHQQDQQGWNHRNRPESEFLFLAPWTSSTDIQWQSLTNKKPIRLCMTLA